MNFKIGILLITICTCLGIQSQTALAVEVPDLYNQFDDVILLNSTSFIPTVFHQNKNKTYVVQFYNTFCGHCQMFAPIYKELAGRLKNWTSVARVAALDCSKDENVITCSENKVEGYPTIYIFPPNAQVQEPSDKPLNLRSLDIRWTVDDIEETLINYIGNLSETRKEYPLVVEAFKPIEVKRGDHIKRLYKQLIKTTDVHDGDSQGLQDLMLVVESENSYLGKQLMLEYFRINHKLEIRRILLSNQALLKDLLTEEDFSKLSDIEPVLLKLNNAQDLENKKAQVLVRGEVKHILPTSPDHERVDFIQSRFKNFFEHFYSEELKEKDDEVERNHFSKSRPEIKQTPTKATEVDENKNDFELEIQYLLHNDPIGSKRIFAIDVLKAITYMITHEVQVKGDLNPSEFSTVRNLLTVLVKYLPLKKWDSGLNKMIVELRTKLDDKRGVYEKSGISAQEMKDLIEISGGDALRLRYSRENYVSCMESERQHKGYPCSLWLLFHSLTVGEFSKAAPVRFRPTLVLYTMRSYITKFFGCTVCSSNFEKESETLETSLSSRNSSVIWLWNTHNRVSLRLNSERPTDKRPMIDVIYPSHRNCPHCIKSDISEVGRDGKSLEDIDWNLTSVLNYLNSLYQPDRIITPVEMGSLLSSVRNKVNYELVGSNSKKGIAERRIVSPGEDFNRSVERWNIQSIFSTSDISLCLFLYLACIMMVAVVCVALNPKLRRFKTK